VRKHYPRLTPEDYLARFWSRVQKSNWCWLWTGTVSSSGYGVMRIDCSKANPKGRLVYAHRYAFENTKGAVPKGLELDHLCRNRRCVNPDHLEPVTPRVNQLRGTGPAARNARKTHCSKGHLFAGQSLYLRPDTGNRQCLICKHEYWKEWYAKKKEKTQKHVVAGSETRQTLL
jgi:hypothetical protein